MVENKYQKNTINYHSSHLIKGGIHLMDLFNLHNLLQIRLEGYDGDFKDYCKREFSHWRIENEAEISTDIPVLTISIQSTLNTNGDIWALGKGLFFNKSTDEILISRDKGTSFFKPSDIYASIPNVLNKTSCNSVIKVIPKISKDKKGFISSLKESCRRFRTILKDPRPKGEKFAETFVSQLVEPLIYRLFLKQNNVLLHAAGLEKNNNGILLFGPQNIGKTTITIGLGKRGWNFLGDDMCLLNPEGIIKSYPKLLKLESEYLKSTPEAHEYFLSQISHSNSFLAFLLKRRQSHFKNLEFKVPSDLLGMSVIGHATVNHLIFLQRRNGDHKMKHVEIEQLAPKDVINLAKQHIATEFDVNKRVDRDIRHTMALYYRLADSLSLMTSQAGDILSKALENCPAYMITLTTPDADALDAIEQITN